MGLLNKNNMAVEKRISVADSAISPLPNIDGVTTLSNKKAPFLAYLVGGVASIGGFMLGYEIGLISGFLAMGDFIKRFGEYNPRTGFEFSAVRTGTIVGLLAIGALVGCLLSPFFANGLGRKLTISTAAFFYIVGVVIELTSSYYWVQFAMGRFVAAIGIGALSTTVPMYQSESIPKSIRGIMIPCYQLAITIGILIAQLVNWGTNSYNSDASWRIPTGLAALWAIVLGISILFMPESPRYAYRIGRIAEARKNMARLNGIDPNDELINTEIEGIQTQLLAETSGDDHQWYEIFTGPRMFYRVVLGMALMAGQQLTGVNFFFFYSTVTFKSIGLSDPYVTSLILGGVNVASTVIGIWCIGHYGRRICLMVGAAWMCICFFVFSFVGHFMLSSVDPATRTQAGNIMLSATCLFLFAFATTWGPMVWQVVGELYPARHRAACMALATSANWLLNFLISFFTTFITDEIHYFYGLVFAGCCASMVLVVYFFMIETNGRSLEEIDTMYLLHVSPITSAKWDSSTAPSEYERSPEKSTPSTPRVIEHQAIDGSRLFEETA